MDGACQDHRPSMCSCDPCYAPGCRWSRPHGRAFDLLMCELQARAAGRKLVLDVDAYTMECGDGVAVRLRDSPSWP